LTPYIDSYSAFFDNKKLGHTELEELVRSKGVTDVFVCGIAYDVCVASTAFHAQELGFRTILVDDCSRGIKSEDIEKTKDKIKENNGCVIHSSEAKSMVQGRDRRVELGYQLALECRKMINFSKVPYPLKNKNSKFNPPPQPINADGSLQVNGAPGAGGEASKDALPNDQIAVA